jgi:hypothetical protein
MKIFYSWQSDIASNKKFIETCLNDAVGRIPEFEIDTATRNTTGSVDIADSIINKIEIADLFIADVSIINNGDDGNRKVPNPNVMYELGYASKKLGWDKIIQISNKDTTSIDDLPFDIRKRRVINVNFEKSNQVELKKLLVKCMQDELVENIDKIELEKELTRLEQKILELKKSKASRPLPSILIHPFKTPAQLESEEVARINRIDWEIDKLETERRFIRDKLST